MLSIARRSPDGIENPVIAVKGYFSRNVGEIHLHSAYDLRIDIRDLCRQSAHDAVKLAGDRDFAVEILSYTAIKPLESFGGSIDIIVDTLISGYKG